MGTLIDDLLAYSRVGRDDRPLAPVPLDDAWDAAVEQLSATIESSDAKVERGALPVVDGDRGQLVQVFANLIGNAVKYRGEATPEVRAEARRANGVWEIAVQDNGIGIDPGDHQRIFEMFRRLHTEDEFEGTGVGLALAKRIVERSGGDIRVESARGSGSRFVVMLPPAGAGQRRPQR
jgi:light-regulated signal transduction histidine kinase (bacteriophytochrome)